MSFHSRDTSSSSSSRPSAPLPDCPPGSFSPCLLIECCLVRNLFTVNRTTAKPRLEHLTQAASFQAVYWRKRSRRRKGGSCVSTFDLSSLACAHLVQLRMPFLLNSCRQSDSWFLLGTGPSVRTRLPLNRALCVRFAICFPGSGEEQAGNQRARQWLRAFDGPS